jgi:hypothetical protein
MKSLKFSLKVNLTSFFKVISELLSLKFRHLKPVSPQNLLVWDEFGGEEPEHGASDLGVGLLDGLLLAEHLVPVEGDHAELYLPREGGR